MKQKHLAKNRMEQKRPKTVKFDEDYIRRESEKITNTSYRGFPHKLLKQINKICDKMDKTNPTGTIYCSKIKGAAYLASWMRKPDKRKVNRILNKKTTLVVDGKAMTFRGLRPSAAPQFDPIKGEVIHELSFTERT